VTTGKDLISELIQALVALALLIPTGFILVFEVVNNRPTQIPDVLAGFDGAVIAFYFRSIITTRVANGIAAGNTASGSKA
jgi:hypothetical protein